MVGVAAWNHVNVTISTAGKASMPTSVARDDYHSLVLVLLFASIYPLIHVRLEFVTSGLG